ncbi:hypothetical protein BVY03_01440, partial [bacterium K02(2017)]
WTVTVSSPYDADANVVVATITSTFNNTSQFAPGFSLSVGGGGTGSGADAFVVTKVADTNDGACTLDNCSLREAITTANTAGGDVTITFAVDGGCSPTCTFAPTSALPQITANSIVIDGYSQTGASENTIEYPNALNGTLNIVVDGVSAGGGVEGIDINGADSVTIKGLVIQRFNGYGVLVQGGGTNNRIQGNYIGMTSGGTIAAGNVTRGVRFESGQNYLGTDGDGSNDNKERNIISATSTGWNVDLNANSNIVAGNFIGVDKDGSVDMGNASYNVGINGLYNVIGTNGNGTSDAVEGNTISGAATFGVYVLTGTGNIIAGNTIGLNSMGTIAIANVTGVQVATSANRIGTDADGTSDSFERNIISGNSGSGIVITGAAATGNRVAGNYIGVGSNGTGVLGNSSIGVSIVSNAADNTVGGASSTYTNIIANNGSDGVQINGASASGNFVLRNTLYDNTGLGINLVSGANDGIGIPTIVHENCAGSAFNLWGTVDNAGARETVQIFIADSNNEEGQTFVGSTLASVLGAWVYRITSYTGAGTDYVVSGTEPTDGTSEFSTVWTSTKACDKKRRIIVVPSQ